MALPDLTVRNLWQCSGCDVLFLGDVGKCNGMCHNVGDPPCDARPCPACNRLHYWTGSVDHARGLTALGWTYSGALGSWAHTAYVGRFTEAAALLVQIGFAHGRPAGSPPRPPAARSDSARCPASGAPIRVVHGPPGMKLRCTCGAFVGLDPAGCIEAHYPPALLVGGDPVNREAFDRVYADARPDRRPTTAPLPVVTVEPPRTVRLDDDTHEALLRLLRASRRNDPTVEVDSTDLALVVEHLADAAGLDTDDL